MLVVLVSAWVVRVCDIPQWSWYMRRDIIGYEEYSMSMKPKHCKYAYTETMMLVLVCCDRGGCGVGGVIAVVDCVGVVEVGVVVSGVAGGGSVVGIVSVDGGRIDSGIDGVVGRVVMLL